MTSIPNGGSIEGARSFVSAVDVMDNGGAQCSSADGNPSFVGNVSTYYRSTRNEQANEGGEKKKTSLGWKKQYGELAVDTEKVGVFIIGCFLAASTMRQHGDE